jgi:hypothetical protein
MRAPVCAVPSQATVAAADRDAIIALPGRRRASSKHESPNGLEGAGGREEMINCAARAACVGNGVGVIVSSKRVGSGDEAGGCAARQ